MFNIYRCLIVVDFSFEKGSNGQNHSLSDSWYPIKISPLQNFQSSSLGGSSPPLTLSGKLRGTKSLKSEEYFLCTNISLMKTFMQTMQIIHLWKLFVQCFLSVSPSHPFLFPFLLPPSYPQYMAVLMNLTDTKHKVLK